RGVSKPVTVVNSVPSLRYEYESRLKQITYHDTSSNTFHYNDNDLRSQKVDSGGTKNFVTDGTSVASPVLADGAAIYTPGLSERRGSTPKCAELMRLREAKLRCAGPALSRQSP